MNEMDQGRETTLERQAKIRARAKELRGKREQERLAIVTDKYEQAFRFQAQWDYQVQVGRDSPSSQTNTNRLSGFMGSLGITGI